MNMGGKLVLSNCEQTQSDKLFVYGFRDDNALAAVEEYKRRFPYRRVSCSCAFSRVHRMLSGTDIGENMENKVQYMLFIEFKKPYDSIKREVLYNMLIEFDIPKKLVRLIKMCLSETYSRVRIGQILSDVFPIHCGLKAVFIDILSAGFRWMISVFLIHKPVLAIEFYTSNQSIAGASLARS
ncbi:hypothetical protein ANN_17344 [Periplaneta americana]|uniref:DUF4817 domain-containing protein n=1 Tax=Periplaneta americana TaxID=6978 RepID=A0ABQ8STQ0_PERAM|nr:hypothetical protein ANN_17344 [Periplaneta americana]